MANDLNKPYLSLEERKTASLDALLFFHDYCEKNNITYYLAYGTLIGAIRHGGFIPWDDDVDIMIPRPDYDKLLATFETKNPDYALVSCSSEKEYMFPYAKLENLKTARIIKNAELDHQGIGIDLFPLDGVLNDISHIDWIYRFRRWLGIMFVNRFEYYMRLPSDSLFNKARRVVGEFFYRSGILKSLARRLDRNLYTIEYSKADSIAALCDVFVPKTCVYKKEWFEGKLTWAFEGHDLIIPVHYDEILREYYGDYMMLPPEDQRVTTHLDEFVWRT